MAADFMSSLMEKLGVQQGEPLSYDQMTSILAKHANKNFVDRIIRPKAYPSIKRDGTSMTHRMAWGEADGIYYVYPTIVQHGNKLVELDPDEAWEYAIQTGESIPFETAEQADFFSRNYKRTMSRE